MPGVTVDRSQWPVVFTCFDGETTPAELDHYIGEFDAIYRLKEPYVSISWMRAYSRDSATVDRVRRWIKDSEENTRRYCLATGIITQSAGFRFILSAIFLVKPMPCPYQVCRDFGEAEAFVRGIAARHPLGLPAIRNPWPALART